MISFIIPLRGRQEHVNNCLDNIQNIYHDYNYEIVIAYQDDELLFKRGQLLNLGAKQALGNILVMQDIDTRYLEKENLEKCSIVGCLPFTKRENVIDLGKGVVKRTGKFVAHGAGAFMIISKKKFFATHGFSNIYFGWGCEDSSYTSYRIKLPRLPKILGHVAHPEYPIYSSATWFVSNHKYYSWEKRQKNFSSDSINHTIADMRNEISGKVKTYYFSNIRVSKDFGQMDWYNKQVEMESDYFKDKR